MQRLARSSPLLCEFAYTSFDHSIRTNETPLDALQFIHLRALKLTFICEQVPIFGSLFNVFESFTAPALTDLSLVVNPFHSWDSEPFSYPINGNLPFHDFVLRSQCELSSLQLSMPLAEESLKKTLSLLSSLSSFIVDTSLSPGYLHFPVSSANYLDIIVRALSPSNESIRCPALKDLYVTSCRPGEAIVLVNLIEARTVHTTELESLRAKFQTSSRTGVGMLKSALELGKSKGLGVKIKWEYRKQYSEGLDSSYPFATSLSDPEVLVG
ncbi:hypothetical protein V5O48_008890 [Marasmius crinis-equi]|uniref:FBD domain-containing protein n=1 Tax=Marasmius crinis-equi TaxID=585013 RepID=A0ABR3FCP7_9AGAR